MKHAYLIMAHNEFEHLQRLLDALDDERNDIYVHIDKKVRRVPCLTTSKSRLTILNKRVNVRWGHISQIKAEYLLLEGAYIPERYGYYHIISGTHFPLMHQNRIHSYFDACSGLSVLSPIGWSKKEIRSKLGKYHIGISWLNSPCKLKSMLSRIVWLGCSRLQRGWIKRNYSFFNGKYSQWVSLSESALPIVLNAKKRILKQFRFTFCGDELFIPSILHHEGIKYRSDPKLLFTECFDISPKILSIEDFDCLCNSQCLFGRKFSDSSLPLIERLKGLKHIP